MLVDNMKIKTIKNIILISFLTPVMVFANIEPYLAFVNDMLNWVIPIIIGITLLVFFWNLIKYLHSIEDKEKQDARQVMFMGIIILFVMISVWGIINILAGTFRLPSYIPRGTRIDVDSLIVPR